MRNRIVTAAVLVLASSTAVFGQAANKAATEQALIANENKINEAVAKTDAKTFLSLLAPGAVAGDMAGFMKAAEFAKTLDQIKIATWQITNPQVIWIDDKSAVVAYTWTGKGTFMNQPIPEKTYASTVWTDQNGKWVAVFHQETTAEAPPPPAKK